MHASRGKNRSTFLKVMIEWHVFLAHGVDYVQLLLPVLRHGPSRRASHALHCVHPSVPLSVCTVDFVKSALPSCVWPAASGACQARL